MSSYSEMVASTLSALGKEVDLLSKESPGKVLENIQASIEEKLNEDPYGTLATALGIGVGLSGLEAEHFKSAAIRLGKLVAIRALSSIDVGYEHQGERNEFKH
jgi:hypothetical protein